MVLEVFAVLDIGVAHFCSGLFTASLCLFIGFTLSKFPAYFIIYLSHKLLRVVAHQFDYTWDHFLVSWWHVGCRSFKLTISRAHSTESSRTFLGDCSYFSDAIVPVFWVHHEWIVGTV